MANHVTRRDFMRGTAGTAAAEGASLFGLEHLDAIAAQMPRPARSAT